MRPGYPSEQILAVEHRRLQRKGIHALHATEVHDVLARPSGRLTEGMDAAGPAEIMFRLLLAPLVQAKRTFLRFDVEPRRWHGMHHRAPSGAERTVAANPMGEGLGLERKSDRAAVATTFVWLHRHV